MRRFAVRKWIKKLRQRWQQWLFYRRRPDLAERHNWLRAAVAQGNLHPVGRAKRGRYD
ncbi:Uncharacterised protein [Mannheimia haemolytica]|uniref:Uncharacterized protein n=1 Tax=Mannheimia haemolytica TaxID=75985 RepID=A0A448T439_MANHA|nr:Uncharacterised protein [Mannheimia haemolytica]